MVGDREDEVKNSVDRLKFLNDFDGCGSPKLVCGGNYAFGGVLFERPWRTTI